MRPADRWFLYLARCGDGSLYAGIARDVRARIAAHEAGKGARYTRGRGPITLAASTRCKDKSEALRLELALKALPRSTKVRLARDGLGRWARRVRSRAASAGRKRDHADGDRKILEVVRRSSRAMEETG